MLQLGAQIHPYFVIPPGRARIAARIQDIERYGLAFLLVLVATKATDNRPQFPVAARIGTFFASDGAVDIETRQQAKLAMRLKTSALDYLPDRMNLTALRAAAEVCRGCELYKNATQTVFGEGQRSASILMLGEIPGNDEDIQGHPFVGPAGRLLDEAIDEAHIARDDVFITNVVKHFRWEPRGKRRLHKKPAWRHIEACKPWLQAEILVVEPKVIVCLGATAAQAMLGSAFRVTKQRGKFFQHEHDAWIMATYHPSAILRTPNREDRHRLRNELVHDLSRAAARRNPSRPNAKVRP